MAGRRPTVVVMAGATGGGGAALHGRVVAGVAGPVRPSRDVRHRRCRGRLRRRLCDRRVGTAAAGLATICEAIGFYGCVGVKMALSARRATAHLAGWHRLAAGACHAIAGQLASCAVAEATDDLLIRPGCLAAAAWLLRSLPVGVWLGFAAGKAVADVAWYGMEAWARCGIARPIAIARPITGSAAARRSTVPSMSLRR